MDNRMYVEFDSVSDNEAFARVTVAAFITRLDPTLEEIEDVKTAVSEAVTNAIIHGYQNGEGKISLECFIHNREVTVIVRDEGVGIEDVKKAMEPLFTTREEEERSGMGFSFMEIFMDSLTVQSKPSEGTTVIMKKSIGNLY